MERIVFGNERKLQITSSQCPGCGVARGSLHAYGWPVESCPQCGGRLIECICKALDLVDTMQTARAISKTITDRAEVHRALDDGGDHVVDHLPVLAQELLGLLPALEDGPGVLLALSIDAEPASLIFAPRCTKGSGRPFSSASCWSRRMSAMRTSKARLVRTLASSLMCNELTPEAEDSLQYYKINRPARIILMSERGKIL